MPISLIPSIVNPSIVNSESKPTGRTGANIFPALSRDLRRFILPLMAAVRMVACSADPVASPTPSTTDTATPTATESPTQTGFATSIDTATPTATESPTQTGFATSTDTATPTATVAPTPTDSATATEAASTPNSNCSVNEVNIKDSVLTHLYAYYVDSKLENLVPIVDEINGTLNYIIEQSYYDLLRKGFFEKEDEFSLKKYKALFDHSMNFDASDLGYTNFDPWPYYWGLVASNSSGPIEYSTGTSDQSLRIYDFDLCPASGCGSDGGDEAWKSRLVTQCVSVDNSVYNTTMNRVEFNKDTFVGGQHSFCGVGSFYNAMPVSSFTIGGVELRDGNCPDNSSQLPRIKGEDPVDPNATIGVEYSEINTNPIEVGQILLGSAIVFSRQADGYFKVSLGIYEYKTGFSYTQELTY